MATVFFYVMYDLLFLKRKENIIKYLLLYMRCSWLLFLLRMHELHTIAQQNFCSTAIKFVEIKNQIRIEKSNNCKQLIVQKKKTFQSFIFAIKLNYAKQIHVYEGKNGFWFQHIRSIFVNFRTMKSSKCSYRFISFYLSCISEFE